MKFIALMIVCALIAAGGNWLKAKPIEAELGEWSMQALGANALDWPRVQMDGRDAYVYGEAPDPVTRQQTLAVVDDVWGVRRAHDRMTLAQDEAASSDSGADGMQTPSTAPDADVQAREAVVQVGEAGAALDPSGGTDDRNAQPEADADSPGAGAPGEAVLDDGGDAINADATQAVTNPALDAAAQCQREFDAAIADEDIQFAFNSAEIDPVSYPLLDRIVEIARGCPTGRIEIGGHTDNVGTAEANRGVSLRRADSVLAYLAVAGIPRERLGAIGYGLDQPIASNDDNEGRARNRRVEFTLLDQED